MPDEEGAIFPQLYRNLRAMNRLDTSAALRQAQLKVIGTGGRFSRPSYWAAYFAVTNKGTLPLAPGSAAAAHQVQGEGI